MHILVQRYLDGELNDLERTAFLEDVAADPRVAELLENEARLDMAIVDDAFAIEPPSYIRTAVLEAVSADATKRPFLGVAKTAGFIVTGLFFLAVSVNRLSTFQTMGTGDDLHEGRLAPVHAAIDPRASAAQPSVSSTTSRVADMKVVDRKSLINDIIPTPDRIHDALTVQSSLVALSYVPFVETFSSVGVMRTNPLPSVWTEPAVSVAGITPSLLRGIISSSGASVRYHRSASDDMFFIESGVMSARTQASMFVNGVEQTTEQRMNLPFALVGIEGGIGALPLLERDLRASVAIGMSAVGPLAVVDASLPLLYLGSASVEAGMRMAGTMDLRHRHTIVIPQPFVSVSVGL